VESSVGERLDRSARDAASALRLSAVQGNVAPGFRKDHQAFVLVHFPDGQAGRRWLRAVRPGLTSAAEVAALRRLFKLLGPARSDLETPPGRPVWLNLALSWDGLRALGADGLDAFPEEFRRGRFQWSTAGRVPSGRGWPEAAGEPVHALLIVAADRADDLERALADQRATLAASRARELTTYRGQTLPGSLRGHEHFGFRDGIAQPRIEGVAEGAPASGRLTRAGEFILGYPNERGELAGGPAWSRDGSYLVFWRLRQHVAAFRLAVRREAARLGLTPEQLAARLVGRWPSGALPGDPIEDEDPGLPDAARPEPSRADFLADPDGLRFPLCAHIRKANPRDRSPEVVERHRLLRRGIPYGPPLAPDQLADDGQDRGLLFLSYQASIAQQFEYVQRQWLANDDFPAPGVGPDALLGGPPGGCPVSLPREGRPGESVELRLPRFVTPTTRGYFFAPSLEAIEELARPPSDRAKIPGEEDMLQSRDSADLVNALRQLVESVVKEQIGDPAGPVGNGAWPSEGPGVVRAEEPRRIDPREYADERDAGFDYSRFLQTQNPYGVESVDPTEPIEAIGPARENDISDPLRKPLAKFTPLEVDRCPRWTFGQDTHRITKAIRIPYRYRHPETGAEIKAWILVGFQGPGY
jgi:Dyp-type peroxidase family